MANQIPISYFSTHNLLAIDHIDIIKQSYMGQEELKSAKQTTDSMASYFKENTEVLF